MTHANVDESSTRHAPPAEPLEPLEGSLAHVPSRECAERYLWLLPVVVLPLLLSLPAARGDVLLFRDILHFISPQMHFLAAALADGRLPEWNPLLFGGVPFLAEPGSGVFYPPAWLALVWPAPRAATVFVLIHLPIAAAGCLLLARTLGASRAGAAFAATGYLGSGYLLSMHGGGYYFASAAWLPMTVALFLRLGERLTVPRLLAAAGAFAAMVFNGEFQGLLFAGLTVGLLVIAQSDRWMALARQAAGALLGICLGAAQLLPSLAFASNSARAEGLAIGETAKWSVHPVRWLELLLPHPFGLPFPDNGSWSGAFVSGDHGLPWAVSLYVGAPVLALAFAGALGARGRWRLTAVLGCLSAVLAVGQNLPVFALWHRYFPLADRFRYPEKFAVLVTLMVCVLAARGFDGKLSRKSVIAFLFAPICLLVLGGSLFPPEWLTSLVTQGLRRSEATASPDLALTQMAISAGTACLLALGTGLAMRLSDRRPSGGRGLLLLLACAGALTAGTRTLSWGDGAFLAEAPSWLPRRLADGSGATGRIFRDRRCSFHGGGKGSLMERVRQWEWVTAKGNFPVLWGLSDAVGYSAATPTGKLEAFRAVARNSLAEALRLLGAEYVVNCGADGSPSLSKIADPLPHAFVAPGKAVMGENVLAHLAAPGFSAAQLALVEGRVAESRSFSSVPAHVTNETPESLEVHTDGPAGILVLADSFMPGWFATIDGQAATILRADGMWRAVELSGGAHVVRFNYRTPGLRAGLELSAGALLLALALGVAGVARRRVERRERIANG